MPEQATLPPSTEAVAQPRQDVVLPLAKSPIHAEQADQLVAALGKEPITPHTLDVIAKGGEGEKGEGYKDQQQGEERYIQETAEKHKGLADRYGDERTGAAVVETQVREFAAKSGLGHEEVDTLKGKSFSLETRTVVGEQVQRHIDTLFNSEQGRLNPEKQRIVTEETQRYLDLLVEAQGEGDISQDISAQVVLSHVEQNVWTLAIQDRAASENQLGDHGVRHLVDHNIRVSEMLADELVKNGQNVKAIDRVILHQVMIDHDLGYAMSPVREPIAQGKYGADGGHNVLAAKYSRERAQNPKDTLSQIFNEQEISVIHQGILYHDSRDVRFVMGDGSETARAENIYSAIHAADNTHAFEDKLPEILYGFPDTLGYMRLMRTAGEIGDTEMVNQLQGQLITAIQGKDGLSLDDKEALVQAAKTVGPESYKRTAPRICGNKPEYALDAQGVLTVQVVESSIHREVVELFAQEENEQLKKFIGDVAGVKGVDLAEADQVVNPEGTVVIKLRVGEKRAEGKTDYQERVDKLISEESFVNFINGTSDYVGDRRLGIEQLAVQNNYDSTPDGSEDKVQYEQALARIKGERKANLERYLSQK